MHPLTDTISIDTAYFPPPPRMDTTHAAHVQRMNNALQARVEHLESTLATRVTVGLLLLLAIIALRVK